MCHHKLWPTSVGHPSSFLNSSFGLVGGKYYQIIAIPIWRLVLQNFAIPGYFRYILFHCYLFPLLSSGWFIVAVCGFISVREWGEIMISMYRLWLHGLWTTGTPMSTVLKRLFFLTPSLPPSLTLLTHRSSWHQFVLHLIINIKSEIWIISHCLGLGRKTMVWAVCLVLLWWICCDVYRFHQHWMVCSQVIWN